MAKKQTPFDSGFLPDFFLYGKLEDPSGKCTYAVGDCHILNPDSENAQAELGQIRAIINGVDAFNDARMAATITKVFYDNENTVFVRKGDNILYTDNIWSSLDKCVTAFLNKTPSHSQDSQLFFLNRLEYSQ